MVDVKFIYRSRTIMFSSSTILLVLGTVTLKLRRHSRGPMRRSRKISWNVCEDSTRNYRNSKMSQHTSRPNRTAEKWARSSRYSGIE